MKLRATFWILLFFLSSLIINAQQRDEGKQDWKNIIAVNKAFGINANSTILTYYQNTNAKWNDWLIPWSLGFGQMNIKENAIKESIYNVRRFQSLSVGRAGLKKWRDGLYWDVNINVVVGNEVFSEYLKGEQNRFFVGFTSSQGVRYIPKKGVGLVLGGGIYEKAMTSKVFPYDIGIQFSVGVHF